MKYSKQIILLLVLILVIFISLSFFSGKSIEGFGWNSKDFDWNQNKTWSTDKTRSPYKTWNPDKTRSPDETRTPYKTWSPDKTGNPKGNVFVQKRFLDLIKETKQ